MNSIKYISLLLLFYIFALPLCIIWIVGWILENCAKFLDNVVKIVGDWFEKQLD